MKMTISLQAKIKKNKERKRYLKIFFNRIVCFKLLSSVSKLKDMHENMRVTFYSLLSYFYNNFFYLNGSTRYISLWRSFIIWQTLFPIFKNKVKAHCVHDQY